MIRHRLRLLPVESSAGAHRAPVRRKLRVLALERLEHRVLLSGNPTVYTVTDTSDNNTGSGTSGDLLYCITQANANTNTAGSLIQFDPTVFSNSNPKTITLAATLELKEKDGPEVIQEGGGTIETPEAVTISGNNTVGVFLVDPGVTATLSGLVIANGQASAMGGGIDNGGTLTVFNCTVENNTAQFGGGIYNNGTLTVTDNTYIQNNVAKAGLGGGIYNDGATVTVGFVGNPTFIIDNSANRGGGIDNDNGGTLTVTGSDLSGNQAKRGGGLINTATSTVTISDSLLLDDGASGTTSNASGGGGFYSSGTGSMTGCTVMRNTAEGSGGGIFVSGGALTITNTTVADNSLSAPMGAGAGVYEKAGTLVAVNCTIAYNSLPQGDSGNGGGIDVLDGTATVDNTIIALNTDGAGPAAQPDNFYVNGGGSVTPASANNLIGIGGGNSGLKNGVNGNLVGVASPGIGMPFENGGPTYSIALFPGSPAIGAGSVALAVDPHGKPLTTDQRGPGYPRIVNGKVDIGAFERPAEAGSPTVYAVNLTSDTGAGSGNEGDLVYVLLQARGNANLAGSVIQFDPTVFSIATPQTITLSNTLELNEPSGPEMIEGPGASALTISGNKAVEAFLVDSGVMATISGLTISGGSASEGGAIYIENGGTLSITDATIAKNSASFGGAIYNNGTLAVSNSAVENNAQAGYGGGIFNDPGGTLTVTNSLIAGNSASQEGGGIASGGTATVINTTIANNSAGGGGGGIYSYGTLTVAGSTIAGSSAQSGGGISNIGGMTTVINTTVANNSASRQGGGIDNEFDGALVVINSTIADNNVGNVVGKGGGLWNGPGTAALYNTILALNTNGVGNGASPDDIAIQSSTPVSGSFNLIGKGGSGGLMNGTNGNQVGVTDAGLDPNGLQDNGGPTQTIALLPNSPAIDTGSATITGVAVPATDQRGFPRLGGNDVGAFQLDPVPTITYVNMAWAGDASGMAVTWTDGSTHYVGYDAFATIQAGVNAVGAGGSVNVAAGAYTEQVTIARNLTLNGAGAAGMTIQAPASLTSGDEISIAGGDVVALSGFTVEGAGGSTGVGDNGGTLTASSITVTGFLTGIAVVDHGAATITDSALTNNVAGIVAGNSAGDSSNVTAHDDNLSGNTVGMDDIQASAPVSATEIWWGSLHGPTSTANPGGNGAQAGAHVNFSPWIGVYTDNSAPGQPGFNPTAITDYAVPTRLVFMTEPSSTATAGPAIGRQPVAEAEDAGGNLGINFDSSTVAGSQVRLALTAGPSSGNLSGTTTVNASAGDATFSGLAIAQPGVYMLRASALGLPWTGLAAATSSTITVNAPIPSLTALSPGQVEADQGSPITLTVTGSGFVSESIVDWNSTALATTYVSSTELMATIPASDLASPGSFSITVTNPAPGGGVSPSKIFQVQSSPPPIPERILGVLAVFQRKTNRKHKPVGKPVLTGFILDFSAPLDPAAASNPANYQIDLVRTKKVKKTVKRIPHPITNFTVSYAPATLAVALKLGSTQTFPTGGQITVASGVTSASGGALEGTTQFAVSKGGKRIAPE
jgi:hypothetical protein